MCANTFRCVAQATRCGRCLRSVSLLVRLLAQRCHAGQHLALKQLQGRAAAGADVAHLQAPSA